MTDPDQMALALGAKLRELRLERGLTQNVLADRIGTYRELVKRVEQGRHLPRLDQLAFYARALDVRLSDLVRVLDDGGASA